MSKSFSGLMNQRSNPESARLEKSETACMKITAGVSLESAPSIEQKTCEMLGSYAETSECELLQAARLGDDKAFIELCRRISPSVKRRIYSILQNQEDTEDALQDTLLRAYVHWKPGFLRGMQVWYLDYDHRYQHCIDDLAKEKSTLRKPLRYSCQ